jgi:hypothetical protein
MKNQSRLPEAYCFDCSVERPEEFRSIREAEDAGAIFLNGHCAKHALAFFQKQTGMRNARVLDGKVVVEIGEKVFLGQALLPDSGMKWESEVAA